MATIDASPLDAGPLWPVVARSMRGWLDARGVLARDAVLLLPFAALLAPAREAFAAVGGWMPRIETTLTLAASLAPPVPPTPGQLNGEAQLDALEARTQLRRQPWAAAREREDRRSFEHIAASLVDAAQALRRAALVHAPSARPAFWAAARAALPAPVGPGGLEALLLAAALEWAAQGAAAATDALFEHQPAAWIVLRLGGRDELAEAIAAAGTAPALLLDADASAPAAAAQIERWVCDGAEQEAWASASRIIQALNAGAAPVALVALDRTLVRRVRALLERQGVPLVDETGWALSTTRAAARVMALLRAAAAPARSDEWLAWLKGWPPAREEPAALNALETRWRGVRRFGEPAAAQTLHARAQTHLQPFQQTRARPLLEWLALLQSSLQADGSLPSMQRDAAGEQVLLALRLQSTGLHSADAAWQRAAAGLLLDLAGFSAWVDSTLEGATFVPPPGVLAQVVLTPLARAIGRPFALVVVPAAEQRHLGAVEPAPALISETLAEQLGADNAARARARQRLALRHLLRAPALCLLRRRLDGDEPLAPSPEVEALALRAAAAGRPLAAEQNWLDAFSTLPTSPLQRPAPSAALALPARLSASAVQTLRACPYRFFARSVLRLAEHDELDAGLEKRDYGTWLHAVLHRFHTQRQAGADDAAALMQAADDTTREQALDAADLLPWRASFEALVPAYLAWLAGRDAAGFVWRSGEIRHTREPGQWAPQTLQGVIDRIDTCADGSLQLIDYKTGDAGALKRQVAEPLEDTQLAFYAALEPGAQSALYLSLDDPNAPLAVPHPNVRETAAVLLEQLGQELQRLRAGAGLPALGEPPVCDHCEARGLCRRDHWSAT